MDPTWKKLLAQALEKTSVPVGRRGISGLWHTHRYIYRALKQAGIENRSPFRPIDILRIRWRSRGQRQLVRTIALEILQQMERPSIGFSHTTAVLLMATLAITVSLALSPRTANTYRTPVSGNTLLKYTIRPVPDLDRAEIRLPMTGDYHLGDVSPLAGIAQRHPLYGLYGADWIRQQADQAYSLQLLSASNPANLQKFCQQHNICAQSAFYRAQVNGKTLYRLLHGIYPSNHSAQRAISALPQVLQQQSPWPRQLGQIKLETRQN